MFAAAEYTYTHYVRLSAGYTYTYHTAGTYGRIDYSSGKYFIFKGAIHSMVRHCSSY